MASHPAWKRAEEQIAAAIGGRRVFFAGAAGDAESEWCVADAKKRGSVSIREIREALAKLAAHPNTRDRLPIVAVFDSPGRGRTSADTLVVMRLQDFRAWFGK